MIKVYVIKYFDSGEPRWFSESLSKDMAFEIGKSLGKLGQRPVIHRIDVQPSRLLNAGDVRTWQKTSYQRRA